MEIRVPVSPEQEELIVDHAIGAELMLYPGERAWMLNQARKQVKNCIIVSADLDIENGEWVLSVTAPGSVTIQRPR